MPDVDGQIVLGLDIAQTTQQMSQDLDTVLKRISKKEITLSAKIDNINFGNAAAQIRNATNQINQEFNSTLNVIDLVNGGIGNLSRMLQGAGFSKGSISTVTQEDLCSIISKQFKSCWRFFKEIRTGSKCYCKQ